MLLPAFVLAFLFFASSRDYVTKQRRITRNWKRGQLRRLTWPRSSSSAFLIAVHSLAGGAGVAPRPLEQPSPFFSASLHEAFLFSSSLSFFVSFFLKSVTEFSARFLATGCDGRGVFFPRTPLLPSRKSQQLRSYRVFFTDLEGYLNQISRRTDVAVATFSFPVGDLREQGETQ